MMKELLWIVGIFAAVIMGVIILALVVKMREVKKAQSWQTTTGRITHSKVRPVKQRGDHHENVRNQPSVSYEYIVHGKRFTGERISLAEIIPESDIEVILERYPVGAQVTVYYDLSDPKQSVLERAIPQDFGKGLASVFALFGGGAVLVLLTISKAPDLLAPYLAKPENAQFVTFAGGMGVLLLLFAFVQKRQQFAMQTWTSTQGQVLAAEVRSFTEWKDGFQQTYYTPRIIYRYGVAGREYTSDRFMMGATISWGNSRIVEKLIAEYPVDGEIVVYYNPRSPAESVLDRRIRGGWLVWAVGVGLLVLAVAYAGIL